MILNKLLETRATKQTIGGLGDPALVELFGRPDVVAGVNVDERSALTNSAFWASVRVVAEPMGRLPLITYRRKEPWGDERERAHDHPVYRLLRAEPNPEMDAMIFRETITAHMRTWGSGYAEIERARGSGEPVHLWVRLPDKIEVKRTASGELFYLRKMDKGPDIPIKASNMLHIRGLSFDGIRGYNVVDMARESIGLGIAAEKFGASFFGRGANPSGYFTIPPHWKKEQKENFRESIKRDKAGVTNSMQAWMLEADITWTPTGVPPENAQFNQTRERQVEEMARWGKIPPHTIGGNQRSTFNNITQEALDFKIHSLGRPIAAWEMEINRKLFSRAEQPTFFAEFFLDDFLRGDAEARHNAHAIAIQWGLKSINEVRAIENQNPIGPEGDRHMVPLNMVPLDTLSSTPPPADGPPAPPAEGDQGRSVRALLGGAIEKRSLQHRVRLAAAYRRLFADASRRVLKKETAKVLPALKRFMQTSNTVGFFEWLDEFYADHRGAVRAAMLGPTMTLGEAVYGVVADQFSGQAGLPEEIRAFASQYVDTMAVRHTEASRSQIRTVMQKAEAEGPGADLVAPVSQRMGEWQERRPEKVGIREAAQLASAVAVASFTLVGVQTLRWVTFGSETCSLCQELDGRVVGVSRSFARKGDKVGAGAQTMTLTTDLSHPPLHDGCECQVVPG